MKGVRPPPCWPCQTNSTVWFHSAATGGNKIKNNPQKNNPVSKRGETLPPLPNPCQKFEKSCILHGLIIWFLENILVSEKGSPPLLAMPQRILQLGSTALPLVATKKQSKAALPPWAPHWPQWTPTGAQKNITKVSWRETSAQIKWRWANATDASHDSEWPTAMFNKFCCHIFLWWTWHSSVNYPTPIILFIHMSLWVSILRLCRRWIPFSALVVCFPQWLPYVGA